MVDEYDPERHGSMEEYFEISKQKHLRSWAIVLSIIGIVTIGWRFI